MILSNSSRSNLACSANLRSFSDCCCLRAAVNSLLMLSKRSLSARSFCRAPLSAASMARLARKASISAALSCAFSCMARSLAVSFSFSMATRSFSSSSSRSRRSFDSWYSRTFCSSSFSASIFSSLIFMAAVFALFTSCISRSAAIFFCTCCSTSSAFSASICFRMKERSWSRCSSARILCVCLSLICSMMTLAPLRWLSTRSFSRTSYIFNAFSRSISIMASSCRSSSSFSAWTLRFSWIWASRIVTIFEYSIIWFMCFTSSMSSSSICLALSKTLFFCARPLFSLWSTSIAFFFRSSSICLIFSFLATDLAMRSA
mmetsp:Transcript_61064/g.189153  ORF Transcript_61064/g.189153 Transcript_61064/m.189153 type:complete len:317 (-) Transcript_61064:427-1377(-)